MARKRYEDVFVNPGGQGPENPVFYDGKVYEAPNAAWTDAAPAEWRETPEGLEQRWTAGYGGAGYKQAQENYDNLSPLEQAIFNNVTAKGQAGETAGGSGGSFSASGSFGGGYTPGEWGGHSNIYKDALDNVMGYQPFSYDYTKDPLYKVYSDEYTRLGQRAMDDTTAKLAARTGGLASSYAAAAGNQAYGNYMAELANKIPELRNQAYNEWQGNFSNLLNKYNVANGYDTFDYGVFSDAEARKRNAYLDNYNQFSAERAYNDSRNDLDWQRGLDAAKLLAQYGDMSGLEGVYGINGLQDRYNAANAIYAFAEDGGTPYTIGSTLGQGYINSLMPGQSVTASDGSVWRKDELGNITITDQSGRTYKISSGQAPKASYTGYMPPPDDGNGGEEPLDWSELTALGLPQAWSDEQIAQWLADNGYTATIVGNKVKISKPQGPNYTPTLPRVFTGRLGNGNF